MGVRHILQAYDEDWFTALFVHASTYHDAISVHCNWSEVEPLAYCMCPQDDPCQSIPPQLPACAQLLCEVRRMLPMQTLNLGMKGF